MGLDVLWLWACKMTGQRNKITPFEFLYISQCTQRLLITCRILVKDRMVVLLCEHRGDVHLVVVGRRIFSLFDSHGSYMT